MGNLLSYSGITTKVRAMGSNLITNSQLCEMAALETVSDAVEYLKQLPAYKGLFTGLEGATPHRGAIEQRLSLSLYQDFARLYRFSNLNQRKFMEMYFMHFEIDILKKCFRNAMGRNRLDIDLSVFQDFFEKHSKLDLIKLSSSVDLHEFIANLEGSVFHDLLSHLDDKEQPALFDYEVHLNLIYFKTIWKIMSKHLTRKELKLITYCFGCKLDLLNIQWIYRSKKYYHLKPADIYSLLIPINYHLNKGQVIKMTEAATMEEFYSVLRNTFYGRNANMEAADMPDLERLTRKILDKIYKTTSRKNPYSIATLNSYLYFKDVEIQKIITIIESIRYRVNPDEIISYVVKM